MTNNNMYPVLITWHFNARTGELELDCFLECDDPKHASAVKWVYVRAGANNSQVSLLHIPKDTGREYVESYIREGSREEVLNTLEKAKVHQHEVVRKKNEGGNSIDFLLND